MRSGECVIGMRCLRGNVSRPADCRTKLGYDWSAGL
jgi:hypothetical protein